jgi:hypothetical protein
MRSRIADDGSRLLSWQHVREFAVPPSMIESATARRADGDWAAACAVSRVDVEFNLRALAHSHGTELTARIRADLRHLAPDLLRWHLPRIAPDGLLRPGLTISLARYAGGDLHLVARTPPAWADAEQRFSLALWDRADPGGVRPGRRFRLDLHPHLWDARRAGELAARAGSSAGPAPAGVPPGSAVDRWPAEAAILLRSVGQESGAVTVRFGGGRRLILGGAPGPVRGWARALPVLPDAATWVQPDLALLRAGLIAPERLHPLVAAALAPDHRSSGTPPAPPPDPGLHLVECRGTVHRLGVVDGVLIPLDHHPDELRREELLAALTGTRVACLQAVDDARRDLAELAGVRGRLDHGDTAGALAVADALFGRGLRDDLQAAALDRLRTTVLRERLARLGPVRTEPLPFGRHRAR